MQYKDCDDYDNKIKEGGNWRKVNNYEVFTFNLCMECRYFKADMDAGSACHGDCSLMEQEGAFNGVMSTAVCDRYLNRRGYDLNGKVVDSTALPGCIKTRKDKKTGETFIVA